VSAAQERAEDIAAAIDELRTRATKIQEGSRAARAYQKAVAIEAAAGPTSESRDQIAVHARRLAKEMRNCARFASVGGGSLPSGERLRQLTGDVPTLLRELGVTVQGSELVVNLTEGRDEMSIDEFLEAIGDESQSREAAE
jgi:hypothetical protein